MRSKGFTTASLAALVAIAVAGLSGRAAVAGVITLAPAPEAAAEATPDSTPADPAADSTVWAETEPMLLDETVDPALAGIGD